jgi:hypothetical protein
VHEVDDAFLLQGLAGDGDDCRGSVAHLRAQFGFQFAAAADHAFEAFAAVGKDAAGLDQVGEALLLDQASAGERTR